jgi:Tfp pilus assembly protein FimT
MRIHECLVLSDKCWGQASKHSTLNTKHSSRRRQAFTLIEMVVLIIIIAIISSVVVPSYTRFYARAKFQRTTEGVVGTLAWARNAAIENSSDCVVRFDAQSGTIAVTAEMPNISTDVPTAIQESPETSGATEPRLFKLGEDVIVRDFTVGDTSNSNVLGANSQSRELRFYEDGSSNGGQMILQSADGYLARIVISPSTGKVQVPSEGDDSQ